jgi:hypothetical protein
LNSFTPDEEDEKHHQEAADFSFFAVDLLLQNRDFTLVRTQMSLQPYLFTVCHRCTSQVWNDKGPMEGPLSNISLSPLGGQWL